MRPVTTGLLFGCLMIRAASLLSQDSVKLDVGDEAPDFELSDSRGKVYRLSDFRGKTPVVLEFFRSGDW